MTTEETRKILFTVRAAYPENFTHLSKEDGELLLLTWQKLLEEYTYAQVSAGLEIYMRTDKYGRAPKVGQIIDAISKTSKQELNANEAWALVYKAICNSNYNSESEFNKLPPLVQKAVGNPINLKEYAAMDIEDVQVTVKAHFKSIYETEVKRADEVSKMPEPVRAAIEASARGFAMIADTK